MVAMTMTRRTLIATAAAASSLGGFAAAMPRRAIVIAHRGCSGERPEHTLMAYRRAVDQGADYIEPDLVMTRDAHLVVRHEPEISGTTDVAAHPEFARRKTTKVVDGESLTGWFVEDFTLAELKTLRARERLADLRPMSAAFDGREAIPTFQEVIDLARAESARTGRTIGIYPEMKHPDFLASQGLKIDVALARALKANQLDDFDAPVFVQCFDAQPLKTFATLSKAKRVQLVDSDKADMVTAQGLKDIASYANGVGPNWALVVPTTTQGTLGPATDLVANAHGAGLMVHPWTVRAENRFLPPALRIGDQMATHGDVGAVFAALYAAGVDGLFSDFPGLAVAARP